jgi:hypothetical protein
MSRRSSRGGDASSGDALLDLSPPRYPRRDRTQVKQEDVGGGGQEEEDEEEGSPNEDSDSEDHDAELVDSPHARRQKRIRRDCLSRADQRSKRLERGSPRRAVDSGSESEDSNDDNDEEGDNDGEPKDREGTHHDALDDMLKDVRLTRSQRAELMRQGGEDIKGEEVSRTSARGRPRHGRGNDRDQHNSTRSNTQQRDEPEYGAFISRSGRVRATRSVMNIGALGGDGESYERGGRNGRSGGRKRGRHDEENSSESSEEEEEEAVSQPYSFRSRRGITRQIMNVDTLGGLGGGMAHSKQPSDRSRGQSGTGLDWVEPRDGYGHLRHPERYTDVPNSRQRSNIRNYNQNTRVYTGGRVPLRNSRRRSSRGSHSNRHRHREHYDSSSESSDSNSSRDSRRGRSHRSPRRRGMDDEDGFGAYERRRLQNERDSIQPLFGGSSSTMGGSVRDKASGKEMLRVDATPVGIDPSVGFSSVGGLETHVRALKEMVVLPLLYPEVFQQFGTEPPRGVLFTGPPGTGKTLTARALANSVSVSGLDSGRPGSNTAASATPGAERKVSFFMRKGADCLSKWVGEGERQLRLLFEQAKRYQPSIIFFDEIDGLAPVRSVKQDQIHASIVSTLLALMDGLDSRGQVVVIGATNRPDAIDPALRRPGRFDRELLFGLPDSTARAEILNIHTRKYLL